MKNCSCEEYDFDGRGAISVIIKTCEYHKKRVRDLIENRKKMLAKHCGGNE